MPQWVRRHVSRVLTAVLLATLLSVPARAQRAGPSALIVIAHPDDDAMFAGAVYKLTHTLGGTVDLALITDGSGGFRYSQLAEPIYGLQLTDEAVARRHLPAIRKRELMEGGAIVGIRDFFFLDQLDHGYTEDVDTVLAHVWDADFVRDRLRSLMQRGHYDYVLVHLPIPAFHGHHKAATILALEAATSLPEPERPVVLGTFVGTAADSSMLGFDGLPAYPITAVDPSRAPFTFDLTQPLDPSGRLDYGIVVQWLIAEHKTQGAMQLLVRQTFELERFWYFAVNDPARFDATAAFFATLAEPVVATPAN